MLPARHGLRGLSGVLALSILIGNFSVVTGLCLTPGPDRPQISLDVCHPLQTPNLVANTLLARPAAGLSQPRIRSLGSVLELPSAKFTKNVFSPDPPPPKALA
jgi:hypothetical protein